MMPNVIYLRERFGASPEEWLHFSLMLGLTADLLPVVSRPDATISPESRMRDVGKTPSRYNRQRQAAGIAGWTSATSTPEDIERWRQEPDYGICLQTRHVRALDFDIPEPAQAAVFRAHVEGLGLPCRQRANSGKFLLAFLLDGDYTKRTIRTAHGIIEFLATGQQFVACGTHPSGTRYEWEGGLPETLPALTAAQFEAVWADLAATFAVEPPGKERSTFNRTENIHEAMRRDPLYQRLSDLGLVISVERDGRTHIHCPFRSEHSGETSESATTYFPPHTGGQAESAIRCLHAHCEHRNTRDFKVALGLSDVSEGDFAPLETATEATGEDVEAVFTAAPSKAPPATAASTPRYTLVSAAEFEDGPPPEWLIHRVLPRAALGVIFGVPGCGKSFLALDMAAAIAEGEDWCGHRTEQGDVVYIAAEGASGFRKRIKALRAETSYQLDRLHILPDAPNFTSREDVGFVLDAIRPLKRQVSMIVVDTTAQVTPGANENSGEDMGKVLAHCRMLSKASGALVALVHHEGKDATKGARGWSGLSGAADVMIQVERLGEKRSATVTKQKDGEDGMSFGFGLRVVVLGADKYDEPISSCVVDHTGNGRVEKSRTQGPSRTQKAVLKTICEMLDLSTGGVSKDDAVEACKCHYEIREGSSRDQRGAMVEKAIKVLAECGLLVVRGDWITLSEAL